jgi:hypothetical protein
VKLGKSKQPRYLLPQTPANRSNSSPYTPRTYADFTTISSTTRNSLPANYSPPVPLHAPPPPHCLRASRILSCTMDLSDSMGSYASRWECKIGDPLRTNDQIKFQLALSPLTILHSTRTITRTMADDRENER